MLWSPKWAQDIGGTQSVNSAEEEKTEAVFTQVHQNELIVSFLEKRLDWT